MNKSVAARLFAVTVTIWATIMSPGATMGSEVAPSLDAAMAAYERGDDVVAFTMFSALAERDDIKAIEMLADMYYYGEGTPKDSLAGYRWSQRGAELGSAEAEYDIGVSLANGDVGPVDEVTGLEWIRRAAGHGSAKAQTTLARYQRAGHLMPRDLPAALANLRLAAAQGYDAAMYELGFELHFGFTPGARNAREGTGWFARAAENRYAPAMMGLASLSFLGIDTPRDPVLGAMWTELAAREGCLAAVANRPMLQEELTPGQMADVIGMADAWDLAHPPRPLHDHQRPLLASGACMPFGTRIEG